MLYETLNPEFDVVIDDILRLSSHGHRSAEGVRVVHHRKRSFPIT